MSTAPTGFSREGVPLDDYLAVALLVFFGVKTIVDANEPKARGACNRSVLTEL